MVETFSKRFYLKSQRIRDKLFRSILILLTKINVSPSLLSNLKIIVFLPYIILASTNLKLAFLFFFLAVLVDLFDGPLARFQKKNSDKGKFLDVFGDFTIYLIIILSLFYLNLMNNNILIYHLFIFPVIAILSVIKKQELVKTDWIIKPAPELIGHIIFLFSLFLFIYFNVNYLNLILLLINIFYTILAIYYFVFIQFRWSNLNKK